MISYFNANAINCVCHSRWSVFRVLGIHNFATKYNPSKADCVIHLNFMFVKKLAMNGKIS